MTSHHATADARRVAAPGAANAASTIQARAAGRQRLDADLRRLRRAQSSVAGWWPEPARHEDAGSVAMPRMALRATVRHLLDFGIGIRGLEADRVSSSRRARSVLAATLAGIAPLLAACSSTSSKPVISPKVAVAGATGKAIIIGGIAPLTGGTDEAEATAGAQAYFRFVNYRGGVFGRRIVYQVLDDHGDPALAPSLAYRLVQQDAVFAVFNVAGTAANVAVARYLNSARVPDVFAGSGCGCMNSAALPYTFGWQLGDVQEGELLGSFVARHFASAKIGVLYEDDQFGREELAGLSAARVHLVATVACAPGRKGLAPKVAALKSSSARVVVAFTSAATTAALTSAMAALTFHPHLVVSASNDAGTDGVITDAFLPSLAAPPSTPAGTWIALFRKVHDQVMPRMPFDAAVIYGMSAAYEFTAALFRSGADPARGRLMMALTGLPPGPAVAPLAYSASDHLGVTGGYVGVLRGGTLSPLTGVLTTDGNVTGTVAPDAVAQPPAPASGLPPH